MHVDTRHLEPDSAAVLAQIGDSQFAVVRRTQLADAGITRHVVDAQLDAGRWRSLNPAVVLLHNGPMTRSQELSAAVQSAEGPVALAGRTAAEAAGLVGWPSPATEIVVVRGAKVLPVAGVQVKVHESRRFSVDDIHPMRTPPQVRIERAVIDAAAWSRSPRSACGIVAAAVQQPCSTVPHLLEMLESAGQVRHRHLLRRVLVDIEGGAHAVSELDFLRFCPATGFRGRAFRCAWIGVAADATSMRRFADKTADSSGSRSTALHISSLRRTGTTWSARTTS